MRTCQLPDCDAVHYGRGYCKKHYMRVKKHGDPTVTLSDMSLRGRSMAERLAARSERRGECLVYTASAPNSHGQRSIGQGGVVRAVHLWAWIEAHGPIPSGMYVRHHCGVPECIEPAHLYLDPIANDEPCSVPDCTAVHRSRGLCGTHYMRWITHGDVDTVLVGHRFTEIDPAERLTVGSVIRGACRLFEHGGISRSGHRTFVMHGRKMGAHRAAWILARGAVPDGLCVLHRCDIPACINVEHLFLGTVQDNNRDRDQKGRHVALPGSRHGNAKLSEWQVQEMLRLRAGGATQQSLANRFGTTQTNVSLILRGRAWSHVPRPAVAS